MFFFALPISMSACSGMSSISIDGGISDEPISQLSKDDRVMTQGHMMVFRFAGYLVPS